MLVEALMEPGVIVSRRGWSSSALSSCREVLLGLWSWEVSTLALASRESMEPMRSRSGWPSDRFEAAMVRSSSAGGALNSEGSPAGESCSGVRWPSQRKGADAATRSSSTLARKQTRGVGRVPLQVEAPSSKPWDGMRCSGADAAEMQSGKGTC